MAELRVLKNFELGLLSLAVLDWPLLRDSFVASPKLAEWSPALFEYMIGCASLELYRDAFHAADDAACRRHKAEAEERMRSAGRVACKKRVMGRPMPIETFVQARVRRWEALAAASPGLDLADAVGVSPAVEMAYVWSAHRRMGPAELERAVAHLAWDRCTAGPDALERLRAERDEAGTWAVNMSALLRSQGKTADARRLLEEHVVAHDRSAFKGANKMDYVLQATDYELAVIAWLECCRGPAAEKEEKEEGNEADEAYRRRKLDECQAGLDKAKGWESFTLEDRLGVRALFGQHTVDWMRQKKGWERDQ
ncbi:hypothetical protein CDD83_843 [Cordyceps sp. RAO-2017]|nr:hypothetical protein CDD83_843 [Cordyceps sp. RAO-2017]